MSKSNFNLSAARKAVAAIKEADFEGLSIDEVKGIVRCIVDGFPINLVEISEGLTLYSSKLALADSKPEKFEDIICAPGDSVIQGPANRTDDPVQYLYGGRGIAILALTPVVNARLSVSHWEVIKKLKLSSIGYSPKLYRERSWEQRAIYPVPSSHIFDAEIYQEINDFIATFFCDGVSDRTDSLSRQKFSVAVSEIILEKAEIDGVVYPCAESEGKADTIALKASSINEGLAFVKSEFIKFEGNEQFKVLDTAKEVANDGTIEWYALPVGHQNKGNRYGTIGWEECLQRKKDLVTQYLSSKGRNRNRPVRTEHGNEGEAEIRDWLNESLPKKYATTNGFIIPDERSMKYVIRNYDVMVYDVLNSPVLWGSTNKDKSALGREQAIPAKFIHAVFEVKATFNRKNIAEALKKLGELNFYKEHLPPHFVSGIIFLEVVKEEQDSCGIADALVNNNIPGYFGGIILSAEEQDPNLSAYFHLMSGEDQKTDYAMPLIRPIGPLSRDEDFNPQLSAQGDTASVISLDETWNFDKGYGPNVANLHFRWSYNSFAEFFLDLLKRLEGSYKPMGSRSDTYGLSFDR